MNHRTTVPTPLVSVIMPVYHHAKEIPACLASVFAQDLTDYEVIVVNDGSTDDLETAIAPWRDRITYVSQENRGANHARNRGFDMSSGRYVIFSDADVIMHPDTLSKMIATLEAHPEASYAYASFRYGWKTFRLLPFSREELKRRNYIMTTSLVRREHFPRFDESLRRLQDWDLWLTMLEQGHVGVWIPEILFKLIPHEGGISAWIPKFLYAIPWERLGLSVPRRVAKYREAEAILKKKHGLT